MSIPVFSVHGFINWAEKQDPEMEYDYTWAETCLLTKYFRSFGIEREFGALRYGPINLQTNDVWLKIAQDGEGTIGAALARAKATLA